MTWTMYSAPTRHCDKMLVILGEAPGADEERLGRPFLGASGKLLRDELFPNAGLDIAQWHMLNVFTRRPPENDLTQWTATKTELKARGLVAQGEPLHKRYLLPEHQWQLQELDQRLRELKPDLILCLGGTALWAISDESSITNYRGTFFNSRYGRAIATYHPAATLRQWSYLPITWADLNKAAAFINGTLPAPLRRRLWLNPTFDEIRNCHARFAARPKEQLGVDIETCPSVDQITTISFSTPSEGICIPIWDRHGTQAAHNYWPTLAEEVLAWRWIKRYAELPNPKVMQNGLYDSQYLLDAPLPIRIANWTDDTAVMQHAYQPELPKRLGTLSSLYLNEPSWKQMRASAKDTNKADE